MASTLDQLAIGESATIEGIGGGAVGQRLMALGLLPGCAVKIVAVAPLRDPITIEIASGRLSLRRAEAAAVTVVCANRAEAHS